MNDPLSEIIALLQPRAVFSKRISGAGRWGVRYSEFGHPSFCAVLEGRCRLAVDGYGSLTLEAGDFVLLPATPAFTLSGFDPVRPERIDPKVAPAPTGEVRHGTRGGRPDVRLLGGYFVFDSPDAALLVSLLPAVVHVRGVERLSVLVRLVGEESGQRRAGRDLVLSRLVEVLLIEALALDAGRRRASRVAAGIGRCTTGVSAAAHAWPGRTLLDRRPACEDSGAVALGILRTLHAHCGTAANGVPACLAHGRRQELASPTRRRTRPRWPNALGTARQVPSAPRSADRWASRRVATRARVRRLVVMHASR